MEKQGLNELAAAVHENAVAHGWWEQERELPEILMLCVSELAEALEEYRAGKPNIYYNVEGEEILYADGEACEKHERRKPEGVAVELADCMIRILDYCGHAGIDIEEAIRIKHEYNKTRPAAVFRHLVLCALCQRLWGVELLRRVPRLLGRASALRSEI